VKGLDKKGDVFHLGPLAQNLQGGSFNFPIATPFLMPDQFSQV
jgi:hypothetical protein